MGLMAVCLATASLAASETPPRHYWQLQHAARDDYSWAWRRRGLGDSGHFADFSRALIAQETGGWAAAARLRFRLASDCLRGLTPGDVPLAKGAQVVGEAELGYAGKRFFAAAEPQVVAYGDADHLQQVDPRRIWRDGERSADASSVEMAPRLSFGVRGLGHAVVLSNRPFQSGEGIFGGITIGSAWRAWPHVVLLPVESWQLGPLRLHYELTTGILDDDRAGVQNPFLSGARIAGSWGPVRLSATWSEVSGGDGEEQGQFYVADISSPSDSQVNNAVVSIAGAWQIAQRFELRGEYGVDDNYPAWAWDDTKLHFSTLGIHRWHPDTAAWTLTADAIDLTGEGDWRAAVEWYRSESYFYDHSKYDSWYYDGTAIGHQDGGNSNSLRFLLQHRWAEARECSVVALWRRYGWRNSESDNLNVTRPGAPGSTNFAIRPWDQYGLHGNWRQPWGWGELRLEASVFYETNREFIDGNDGFAGHLGAGYGLNW